MLQKWPFHWYFDLPLFLRSPSIQNIKMTCNPPGVCVSSYGGRQSPIFRAFTENTLLFQQVYLKDGSMSLDVLHLGLDGENLLLDDENLWLENEKLWLAKWKTKTYGFGDYNSQKHMAFPRLIYSSCRRLSLVFVCHTIPFKNSKVMCGVASLVWNCLWDFSIDLAYRIFQSAFLGYMRSVIAPILIWHVSRLLDYENYVTFVGAGLSLHFCDHLQLLPSL